MARKPRLSPPDRDGDGTPGGSLPGNETVPEAKGPELDYPEHPAADPVDCTVTNCLPGTTLHLADGTRLAYGESATVSEGEAVFLRERGQAK